MTMGRELRSSKRQRLGCNVMDPLSSKPVSQDERLGSIRKGVNALQHDGKKLNSKVQTDIEVMELTIEADKHSDKIVPERTEDRLYQRCFNTNGSRKRSKHNRINEVSCEGSETNRHEYCSEIFPEQNDKLANTLLSLKGISSPSCSQKRISSRMYHKRQNDMLKEENVNHDAEVSNASKNQMELQKLKDYINLKGGKLQDGWKVYFTKGGNYKNYRSPTGIRFRSMKGVAKYLGVFKRGDRYKHVRVKLEDAPNTSVCTNSIVYATRMKPYSTVGNGAKVNEGTTKATDKDCIVLEPLVLEPVPENKEDFVPKEPDASSRNVTVDMKGRQTLEKIKVLLHDKMKNLHRKQPWLPLLEDSLKTSTISADVLKNNVKDALEMSPPEWVKRILQPLISSDVLSSGSVQSINGSIFTVLERSYKKALEESECQQTAAKIPDDHVLFNLETETTARKKSENQSVQKDDVFRSSSQSEAMTKCCRHVWQDITSTEKFAALCKLICGTFSGSRLHEVVDFQLIELRMAAGTYGLSPSLFHADMREIWNKLQTIGQEMIDLANALSELSHTSYEKQVSPTSLFLSVLMLHVNHGLTIMPLSTKNIMIGSNITTERLTEKSLITIKFCGIQRGAVDVDCSADVNIIESASANESPVNQEHSMETNHFQMSRKENNRATVFSSKQDGNNICLSSANMQTGSGTREMTSEECLLVDLFPGKNFETQETDPCPNTGCAVGTEHGTEGHQAQCKSCGRVEDNGMLISCPGCKALYHKLCVTNTLEAMPENWLCVSCCQHGMFSTKEISVSGDITERKFKKLADVHVSMNSNAEHASNKNVLQYTRENGSNKNVLQNTRENGDLDGSNKKGVDREQLDLPTIRTEGPIFNCEDKRDLESNCKICSVGVREGDFLIECSNESCPHKFYHLKCLRPPLASAPSPSWLCPSCLCRSCFKDENDENIVLCDDCDDAYHTYCMQPALKSIPANDWYCPECLKRRKKQRNKRLPVDNSPYASRKSHTKKSLVQALYMHRSADSCDTNLDSEQPCEFQLPNGSDESMDKTVKEEEEEGDVASCRKTEEDELFRRDEDDDASIEYTTDKFIVRLRPKHMAKFTAYMEESKEAEAGKRKRKCSEPRRSQV